MSQSSNLQFSINESVWLRDGQEAEDVLSMALEPDITIEENPHYVSIKGALRLSGEYTSVENSGDTALDQSHVDRPDFRVVDELRETDDGTIYIEHRFPVDITIPANRVEDIDDLYVSVESFDYELPEVGCIQLEADVLITGLVDPDVPQAKYSEANQRQIIDESELENENAFDPTEALAFESYREPEEETAQEQSVEPEVELTPREDEEDGFISLPFDEREEEQEFESEASSFDVEVNEIEEEEELVPLYRAHETFEEDSSQDSNEESIREDTESFFDEEEVEDNLEEQEQPDTNVQKKKRNENALYLTKMLTNEEDQFSKVRMCIVQTGDSLEGISERYQVPVTSLLRRNHLDSDQLEEGQILYIPVNKR
ncbi:stage VI sporulation protein D [Pullulanibacillus pueri]|uniref:Stage VI sporulation protein D n=1 Tax=Pullulanibacillus pueri TaxID=1437324 RepID=A0A8J3EPU6_9BACL|nr:stage VI sporulation protein D [Pullulanibacillus pueri]MBM7681908.1 stage VI sporulation protein D [Pullulanibacillus pueri]GGH89092.1 stage VI sporulation protein D [Pullulanibacillus pueri]